MYIFSAQPTSSIRLHNWKLTSLRRPLGDSILVKDFLISFPVEMLHIWYKRNDLAHNGDSQYI